MYLLIGVTMMLGYYLLAVRSGQLKKTTDTKGVLYTVCIGLLCLVLWPVILIVFLVGFIRESFKEKKED